MEDVELFESEILDDLLAKSTKGDAISFQTLSNFTKIKLYNQTLFMQGYESTAKDALEKSYIKVWNHGAEYHSERGKIFTWLCIDTSYTANDVIRKHKRQTNLEEQNNESTNSDALLKDYEFYFG